jgi:HSF-type DNA-binding
LFQFLLQQLNFYSFRKIKYNDSIRIDLETEKRTANYWRFRHEHFQRGRADLLTEIKRMNGKTTSSSPSGFATLTKNGAILPATVASAPVVTQVADKEVLKLKKRIDEMTKNMDRLTEMVQKVSLHQESCVTHKELGDSQLDDAPGMKRKKPNQDHMLADPELSMDYSIVPDVAISQFDMEELASLPLPSSVLSIEEPPPLPTSSPFVRETSDTEFVDQLFSAFENDEATGWLSNSDGDDEDDASFNRPAPELMKRLSDALALLPRDVQEMIVNRLISAIISPDGSFSVVPSLVPPTAEMAEIPVTEAPAPVEPMVVSSAPDTRKPLAEPEVTQQPLPLAAATLAALLHHYSNQVKEQAAANSAQQQQQQEAKKAIKSLPVIPVHA